MFFLSIRNYTTINRPLGHSEFLARTGYEILRQAMGTCGLAVYMMEQILLVQIHICCTMGIFVGCPHFWLALLDLTIYEFCKAQKYTTSKTE